MEYYVIIERCMFRKINYPEDIRIFKIRFGSSLYIYDLTLEKWVQGFTDIKGTCDIPTKTIPKLFKAREELLNDNKDWVLWQLF